MKLDIIISADYIREDIIKDKVVVVIDMLRATSVITTAFMNGCKEVIPLLTVEEAFEKRDLLKERECILGGERRAVKIDGFDLSNSPLEYTKEAVEDKTIIITTTNGTRTLTSCTSANRIFIGAMINAGAVAKKVIEINKDVIIVNSGTNGEFSMDDFICSGFIINEMTKDKNSIELTDIAKTALKIYKENDDIISYVKEARHYNVMLELNLESDIEYCIQKNITDIVPEYRNLVII